MINKAFAQVILLLRVSLASINKRSMRVVINILGTSGVIMVLVSILSISEGYDQVVSSKVQPLNFRILMEGASAEIASSISAEETAIIRRMLAIAKDPQNNPLVSTEIYTTMKLAGMVDKVDLNVPLRGVEYASYQLNGVTLSDGRLPTKGRREIVVGSQLINRVKGLAIGEKIKFANAQWTVVGHFKAENRFHESEIWAPTSTLSSTLNRGSEVQTLLLKIKPEISTQAFIDNLDNDPRLHVYATSQRQYMADQSKALRDFVSTLGYGISAMMAIGAIFAALGASQAAINSRIREIGTFKALGFYNSSIVLSIIIESLILTLLGAASGASLAYFIFDGMQTVTTLLSSNYTIVAFAFSISFGIIIQALILAMIIGVSGSIFPALKVIRIPISKATGEKR